MPILTRLPKSMPARLARKPWTKCCRAISPSVTVSMPASSCSLIARTVASRLACSRASPSVAHGAHSILGFASQAGFGRLPAMVVSSMTVSSPGRTLQRGDEAGHRCERIGLLVAMRRVHAVLEQQLFERPPDPARHGVNLRHRAILVVDALNRERRTGHAG